MTVLTKETQQIISADKVAGTAVYGANKEKMGTVDTIMLGKRDGKVHHAILSIGGFFGMGDKLHSIPWEKLDYDTDLEGYKLNVNEDQLKNSPSFDKADRAKASDRDFQRKSYDHYGVSANW